MGFARDRVEGALRRADNDTALALNILLDPEAAAETAAAEPEPAAQASSAAVAAKAVAADARGWARVADRARLAQLLAEEFGEEGGAALLDQAAAAAATAAAAAAANPPPAPPLTLTIDQGFSGSQQDHEKHPWASVNLQRGTRAAR